MPDLVALERRWARLDADTEANRTEWRLLGEFLLPRHRTAGHDQRTAGEKFMSTRVYDAEGLSACQLFASALGGMLTSPAQPWFSVIERDPALNERRDVRKFLETLSQNTLQAITQSNAASELGETYQSLVALGTGCLLIDQAAPDRRVHGLFPGLQFTAVPIGDVVIAEDPRGRVDTVIRSIRMSARQIQAQFPEADLPDTVRAALEANPDDVQRVRHAVLPNEEYDPGRRDPRRGRAWASIYYLATSQAPHELARGGYYEFPYAVPRWGKIAGDVWGYGPGHTVLPDVRTLNEAVKQWLQAGARAINPPLLKVRDMVQGLVTLEPAGINVVDSADALTALDSKTRYEIAVELLNRLEQKIRRVLMIDQIQMPLTGDMTLGEFLRRLELNLRLLGPVAGRLQDELLEPIIWRCVKLQARAGVLPEVPDVLLQQMGDLDIEYEGPLARSQKSADLDAIDRVNAWATAVTQATGTTEVWDNIDVDAQAQVLGRLTGAPADTIRDPRDVAAIRQRRLQQQQQAAQMQQVMDMVQTAGKAAPLLKAVPGAQGAAA